ncbi:MAG: hypothetical protein ACYDH8_14365 [Syntrophales bacterium]
MPAQNSERVKLGIVGRYHCAFLLLPGNFDEWFFYCTHTTPRETYDLLPGQKRIIK